MGRLKVPNHLPGQEQQQDVVVPYSLRLIYDVGINRNFVVCLAYCSIFAWPNKFPGDFEKNPPMIIDDLPSFANNISSIKYHDKHKLQVMVHLFEQR